jgi:hypothetical protein
MAAPEYRAEASRSEAVGSGPRQVNRRIHEFTSSFDRTSEYVCECGQAACAATMLAIHPREFADVLTAPGALLVARGHELPETRIVRQRRGYVILLRSSSEPGISPASAGFRRRGSG